MIYIDIVTNIIILLSLTITLSSQLTIVSYYSEKVLNVKSPHKIMRKSFYFTVSISTTAGMFYLINLTDSVNLRTTISIVSIYLFVIIFYSCASYIINKEKEVTYEYFYIDKLLGAEKVLLIRTAVHTFALVAALIKTLKVIFI